MATDNRPLSPHLMIYRLTLTFVMSGLHRITGFFLYFGTVLLVWWLLAAASGPSAYAWFTWAAKSWFGRTTARSPASSASRSKSC